MRTSICLILAVLSLGACGNQRASGHNTDRPTTLGSCKKQDASERVVQIIHAVQTGSRRTQLKEYRINWGGLEATLVANGYEYTFHVPSNSTQRHLQVLRVPEGKRDHGPVSQFWDEDGNAHFDHAEDRPLNNGHIFRTCDLGEPNPELEQKFQAQYEEALSAAEQFYSLE